MKKSFYILALIFLLGLSAFSGCGGGSGGGGGGGGNNGGGGSGGDDPAATIQFNVFDKSDGKALSGVALSIEETGQQLSINESHTMKLDKGTYTVYLGKEGYTTREIGRAHV